MRFKYSYICVLLMLIFHTNSYGQKPIVRETKKESTYETKSKLKPFEENKSLEEYRNEQKIVDAYTKTHPKERLIYGYEIIGINCSKLCGDATKKIEESKIVVRLTEFGSLYIHSNYIAGNSENTSKTIYHLSSNNKIHINDIINTLFFTKIYPEKEKKELTESIKSKTEFIFYPDAFREDVSKSFDNEGIPLENVKIACKDGAKPIFKLETGEFVIDYSKKNKIRIIDYKSIGRILDDFKKEFNKHEEYQIIPLIVAGLDKTTDSKLKEFSKVGKVASLDFFENSKEKLKEDFKANLKNNPSYIKYIVGHVENNLFVVRDKEGVELFSISLTELNEFKEKEKLTIVYQGCKTALQGAATGGVITITTVEALDCIAKAHDGKQKTNEEYWNDLAPITSYNLIGENIAPDGSRSITIESYDIETNKRYEGKGTYYIDNESINADANPSPNSKSDYDEQTPLNFLLRVFGVIVPLVLILFGSFYLYNKIYPINRKHDK